MNDSGGEDDEDNLNDGIQGQKSCETCSNAFIELNVPTNELKTSTIQNLMLLIKLNKKKETTCPKYDKHLANVTDKIWNHLMAGLPTFDDQLLCATFFYTVLNATEISTKQLYMQKVLQVIQSELIRKENGSATDSETRKPIALMYGMFQSNFLTYTEDDAQRFEENLDLKTVTKTMIKLLILMAYEYSKFTYITFKTMSAFEKILGLPAQDLIFDKETCDNLLVMINHNWENPITGVRDLNKKVLYTCLSAITSHEDMKYGAYYTRFPEKNPYDETREITPSFFEDVQTFGFNKAKYLMGAEMIKSSFATTSFNDAADSLQRPGVVAAGADLYYIILERTDTLEDWCSNYLRDIEKLLNGPSERAIENFTNYWCIPTFKKFPAVLNILIYKLGEIDTENKLLSLLSLYKQANKLGIMNDYKWKKSGDSVTYVLDGLVHCNPKMRILAFEILCTSQIKDLTDLMLYELIMFYIKFNINSDCRVLRINMLKSLTSYFIHLHEIYRGKVKNKQPYNEDEVFKFCSDYQESVAYSLKINGNYQRKVTCIELIDIFLNNLSNVQRKRKEPTKVETSLVKALECKGLLIFMTEDFKQTLMKMTNDPADDIRENTNKVLLKYYVDHVKKPEVINNIIDEALRCLSSKFFYEISCGHSKFNLIIDVLVQNRVSEATFKSVEDILQFAFENLMSEHKLGRGIVESIEKGKQLHSYITLLCTVLQKCQENNYHIQFSREKFFELLEVLRGISNQFVWEQEDSISSDFAKINEMVEDVISKSGYDIKETDETKLSGMHQIVLNCLWLNVKASCELSCIVIQYQKHEDSRDICESALATITRVLETCRHKGAIEAAGVALGKAIRHLTSVKSHLSSLPMEWLQNKMRELVSQSSAMASVTRRGAGLSIMLHRAVANDTRKDKPLFQYFMDTILEACNKAEIASQPEETISNKNLGESSSDVGKESTREERVVKPMKDDTKVDSLKTDTEQEHKRDTEKELSYKNTEIKPIEENKLKCIKRDTEKDPTTENTEIKPIEENKGNSIQTDKEKEHKRDTNKKPTNENAKIKPVEEKKAKYFKRDTEQEPTNENMEIKPIEENKGNYIQTDKEKEHKRVTDKELTNKNAEIKPIEEQKAKSINRDTEKEPTNENMEIKPIEENKENSIKRDTGKEPTNENTEIKCIEEKKVKSIQTDTEKEHKKDTQKEPTNESTEIKLKEENKVKSIKRTEKYPKGDTENEPKQETGKDVPKAVYIHFLTRIVTDSSLTCDIMFYSAEIAELAFGNLNSPHWQIRNAALQLYGALLPKLIGQKKSSDDQPVATVGCDELRTHSPKLWNYMMQRLNNETFDDVIQYHSTLVPILNVLANCAKRHNLHTDIKMRQRQDETLLKNLERLLSSPIHAVRKLAAKSIYNVTTHKLLQKMIIFVPHNLSENEMNGRLMLLGHYVQDKAQVANTNTNIEYALYEHAMYSKNGKFMGYNDKDKLPRSYWNKQMFVEAFDVLPSIENTWDELFKNSYAPGVEEWALKCFEKGLSAPSSWEDIPLFLITIMKFIILKNRPPEVVKFIELKNRHWYMQDVQWFDGEAYLEIVLQKVEKAKDIPEETIKYICRTLLKFTRNASYATWKILYEIVKRIDPQKLSDVDGIASAFDKDTEVCYKTRYAVPFAARIVQVLGNISALTRITFIIVSWTDAETTDCDLRYIAALAINELAHNFQDLPNVLKKHVMKSAVLLLQDEDENVRNTSAVFYKNLVKLEISEQPYICLMRLLEFRFLSRILSKQTIYKLCEVLTMLVNKLSTPKKVDEYNPFSNDSSNIYLETDVLKNWIRALQRELTLSLADL